MKLTRRRLLQMLAATAAVPRVAVTARPPARWTPGPPPWGFYSRSNPCGPTPREWRLAVEHVRRLYPD